MSKIQFRFDDISPWPVALRNFCNEFLWDDLIGVKSEIVRKLSVEHPEAFFRRDTDPFFTLQITEPNPIYCIEFPDDGSYTMFILRWG